MDAELERLIGDIGPRLNRVRQDRGLTLDELAGATGISVSTLSRLESGKRRPTLDLLLPLARVYRMSLEHMIGAPQTGDPRAHLTPHHRETRTGIDSVVIPLTTYPGRIQVFKQILSPTTATPTLVTHPGHAFFYVLAGTVRLLLGDRERLLKPGDNADFDAGSPHWFGPAGDSPAEILHLYGPHGDRFPAG
ncbi:transcriptional regulator with XRE-family HTH domain [Actinoplanes campanulatus]|uniref:Transcriptional regulator with XRE-family HTH domain n=1 Tax=Actinoplanes campanulatus TaxID=113559 RepID=A0A7W5FEP7_9ACTN|nr:XRE family transcriptional regulator [Actinoplanes campanulatus]MBB3095575.1 transcriptional regulator with XRE-family HTH domain [Actinoplanes campanulatus]GGN09964.1 XRE family transcriptional regulator [Actinoplanes campanulatus]GID36468.1 XRE family transcriptional regulator [Actinoplanes campanulatus]